MSDTLLEPEDARQQHEQIGGEYRCSKCRAEFKTIPDFDRHKCVNRHQVTKSGTCVIPGCPCRGWSAQEAAGVKEVTCIYGYRLDEPCKGESCTAPHQPAARGGGESDPWKAVHRIKLKYEAVVEAAIVAVNCYEWQGEQQAQFLSEAMQELKNAVVTLRPDAPTVKRLTDTEHNRHQALVAERERLRDALLDARQFFAPQKGGPSIRKDVLLAKIDAALSNQKGGPQ